MDFDNILEGFKENKKKIFLFALLFIGFIVITIFISNIIEDYNDKKKLEKALISLGERVYVDAYYNNLRKEPKEYEKNGIKITLDDMFDIVELDSRDYFYNRRTKETCNTRGSYVKIFPKSPYGINDYELDFVLDCGY